MRLSGGRLELCDSCRNSKSRKTDSCSIREVWGTHSAGVQILFRSDSRLSFFPLVVLVVGHMTVNSISIGFMQTVLHYDIICHFSIRDSWLRAKPDPTSSTSLILFTNLCISGIEGSIPVVGLRKLEIPQSCLVRASVLFRDLDNPHLIDNINRITVTW